MFITSAYIPSLSNSSLAFNASQTKCPVAIIVTSAPGFNRIPFPTSNPVSCVVKLGTFGRPKRK